MLAADGSQDKLLKKPDQSPFVCYWRTGGERDATKIS